MRTVSIAVFGKVQGVWFRGSTLEKARSLEITGWVCNKADGSVYMEASGSAEQIKSLIEWCHQGPSHAIVEQVVVQEMDATEELTGFIIKR